VLPGVVSAAKYAAKGFVTESFTCTSGGSALRPPARGWSVVAGVTGSVVSMARGLAIDLAPLRVNCIVPGFVDTEMWTVRFPDLNMAPNVQVLIRFYVLGSPGGGTQGQSRRYGIQDSGEACRECRRDCRWCVYLDC
jgi:NAD(P)-dependent dehydrogenase (short-subunit alcohol dehydrogenase family)